MRDGHGYGVALGQPPDSQVASDVGNALVDVFLATDDARYAGDVSAAVRPIVSRTTPGST